MFGRKIDHGRPVNAFADLEHQLHLLGSSGERLAEAASSLRASARVFARASARLAASTARPEVRRRHLKLI